MVLRFFMPHPPPPPHLPLIKRVCAELHQPLLNLVFVFLFTHIMLYVNTISLKSKEKITELLKATYNFGTRFAFLL